MESVLIAGVESVLSETMREVLEEAGYDVTVCSDVPLALNLLRVAEAPVVVILAHGGSSRDWEPILSAVPELPPHAYLLLSTDPGNAPSQANPHTQVVVPVVPMPFDVERLLREVVDAVGRLQSVLSCVRRS